MSRDPNARARRGAGRGANVDLFKMTTGALAVQESLQLDAMADVENAAAGINRSRSHRFFGAMRSLSRASAGWLWHSTTTTMFTSDSRRRLPTTNRANLCSVGAVQMLPYLGQNELFRKFRMDEPWDSPSIEN